MRPILFSFGLFHFYSFGILVALGVVISLYLMTERARRDGFPAGNQVGDLLFIVVAAGLVGARIHYAIQNADWYLAHPLSIFALWEGGLIFYGGMFSSFVAVILFMKVKKIPFSKGFDFLCPYVALTHAFGRLGCFMTGCCYGRACNLPWAVQFPELPSPVHPTQLYEAFFLFALFAFLNWQYSRKKFDGQIMALYFVLYPIGRFVIEFFRADNPFWGFFTRNQWLSLAVFVAASGFYYFRKQQAEK